MRVGLDSFHLAEQQKVWDEVLEEDTLHVSPGSLWPLLWANSRTRTTSVYASIRLPHTTRHLCKLFRTKNRKVSRGPSFSIYARRWSCDRCRGVT